MSETETEPIETSDATEDAEPAEPAEPEGEGDAPEAQAAPEPEPEPEPGGLTPEQIEERGKKADKSFDTYARRVTDIYEEDGTQLLPCPLCASTPHGFVWIGNAGRYPEDVKAAVLQYLGFSTSIDYKRSGSHSACPACDGLGKVQTGSRVPNWETVACGHCEGRGFVSPQGYADNGASAITALPAIGTPDASTRPATDSDPTGEPRFLPDGRENPNYMKWPQGKVLVPPWGVTAGLTAQDAVAQ